MKPNDIAITGIGLVRARGTAASIWKHMNEDTAAKIEKSGKELDFTVDLSPSQLRRVNRYSKLALAAAMEAQKNAGIAFSEASAFRRGFIFTTGYGSIVANVRFVESIAKGDPHSCSPTLFSGTVTNSAVGQVCALCRKKWGYRRGGRGVLVGKRLIFRRSRKKSCGGHLSSFFCRPGREGFFGRNPRLRFLPEHGDCGNVPEKRVDSRSPRQRRALYDTDFRNVLVTGFDPAGNYNCLVPRRFE